MRSVSKGITRVSRGSLRFPLSRILPSSSCAAQNLSEKCIMNLTNKLYNLSDRDAVLATVEALQRSLNQPAA